MNRIWRNLEAAKDMAVKGDSKDATRTYRLGAIGIRSDGTTVRSCNLPNRTPHPSAHAEARLTKKLDVGAVVYVARIGAEGDLRNAQPCKHCRRKMRSRGVSKCIYSIRDNEYGVIEL